MPLPRPSRRVTAAGGFQFFYDRYALVSAGFKLAGMQMRSDGREAIGYVFSRGGHVFLGTHAVHQVSRAEAFVSAMEHYDDVGILVPRDADIGIAMSAAFHAYQLTARKMALRTLLGPERARMRGPWVDIVLAEQAAQTRRLAAVWQHVSRAFRNDPVAKANAAQRVTVPTWFAAYWIDRLAVAGLSVRRPWRPPGRSRVPRLPKRYRV